jgi:hypothetical protein
LFPATHPGAMLPWEIRMEVLIAKDEFLLQTIKSQTGGLTQRDVEKVFLTAADCKNFFFQAPTEGD